jgi:hypothetical protein
MPAHRTERNLLVGVTKHRLFPEAITIKVVTIYGNGGPVITLACVLTLSVTTEHNKGVSWIHLHPIADQRKSIELSHNELNFNIIFHSP